MERSGEKMNKPLFQDCFLHNAQIIPGIWGKVKEIPLRGSPGGEHKRSVYREEMRR
jgi:hypothetical protein